MRERETTAVAGAPSIRPPCPKWLRCYVRDGRISREVCDHLCEWADDYGVYLRTIETERVYYRAVAGQTTEAVVALESLLDLVTCEAVKNGRPKWGEDMSTITRRYCGKRLLLDARKELMQRVCEYLPSLIGHGEQPEEDALLLHQVLDAYK